MTKRERLLATLAGRIPDCVPVMPDISNMVPAKLTGKPFWDLYLYNDPPIWEAYIAAARYFDLDSLMDGYAPLIFPEEINPDAPQWEQFIVNRTEDRIVTQQSRVDKGERIWAGHVTVYRIADPPVWAVPPEKLGLPPIPERWEPVEGAKPVDYGPANLGRLKRMMGDNGLVGAYVISSCAIGSEEALYHYHDNPDKHEEWAQQRIEAGDARFHRIMALDEENRPDFLAVGGSGTLIWQTPAIFRQLALPALKHVISLAADAGIPTHIHSCGPERELVKIMALETELTIIDPLERPPMGDCDLAELKRLYGDKICLKGNLHTTDTMWRGTVEDVVAAAKQAIDDAAEGGRFVLSTGDQCGRDTPFENLHAMVEVARTYGRY